MNEVEFLQSLVEISSPTGKEEKVAEFLLHQLKGMGFHVEMDEVGNVLASNVNPLPQNPTVLFCGHIDTVPGNIMVRIQNNQLFGRGSVDAKGPLAAFIQAAQRINKKVKKPFLIACCVDEEGNSKGARALLSRFNPTFVVIGEPSGGNALTIGYRGVLKAELSCTQPTFHSSHSTLGAAEHVVECWNAIREYEEEYNRTRNPQNNITERLDARIRKINIETDGLNETARMTVSIRIPTGCTISGLELFIQSLDSNVQVRVEEGVEPYTSTRANPLANAFSRALRSVGVTPTYKTKTGTADFNLLGHHYNVPILAYGPGDSTLDHTPHECVSIEEYLHSISIIEKALLDLLN